MGARAGFLVSGRFENGKLSLSIENERAVRLRVKLCEGGEYTIYAPHEIPVSQSVDGVIDAPVTPGLVYTIR